MEPKRKKLDDTLRIQTDQEFNQNEIKKLNEKYNVDMFNTSTRGEIAFTVEQEKREVKKIMFRTKISNNCNDERLQPNKLIQKATNNLNNIKSVKYDSMPEEVKKTVWLQRI